MERNRGDRLHGQVVTVAFSQKLEDSKSCELCRMIFENSPCAKNIQVQLEIDTIGK